MQVTFARKGTVRRQPLPGPRRRAATVTAGICFVGGLALGTVVLGHQTPEPKTTAGGAPTVAATRPPSGVMRLPPGETLLATASGRIARFAQPGGKQAGWIPATWHSALSTLPVIATRPGWLRVRLAQRPDGSTAWVRVRDVILSTTPYRIVINLATTHLALYNRGKLVFSAPAGVGATNDPTPTGQFFVAFLAAPPAPGYGAFVLVTSAHSNAITDWQMSGDAMVAIHGPLGADAEIGTTGAHISHGCIRLHGRDLDKLGDIPAGTPVTIVAS